METRRKDWVVSTSRSPGPVSGFRRDAFGEGASDTPVPTGGHEGRPYGAPSNRSVGRGAHTPPNQAAGPPGLRESRPGHGGMRACRPTAFAGGAPEIAALPGRIYNPPLKTRLRPSRRGGLYARPDRVPIPTGVRWFHRRRGALYMRPCRTAGITGPASEIAGLPGRIYNPPLRVRSAMVHPTRRCGRPYGPAPGGVVKTILEV